MLVKEEETRCFGVFSYFSSSILDCRTWRWYSIDLTSLMPSAAMSLPGVELVRRGIFVSLEASTLSLLLDILA